MKKFVNTINFAPIYFRFFFNASRSGSGQYLMRFIALIFSSVFFVLILGVANGFACSCLPSPTVLDEFDRSDFVFVATFQGLEEASRRVDGTNVYRTYNARMTVEKAYKGKLVSGQEMIIRDGDDEGTCSKSFLREKIGQKFLFYMREPSRANKVQNSNADSAAKVFYVSICSRSEKIEDATADLSFLDNKVSLDGKTRLSGTVVAGGDVRPSVANIRLRIVGQNIERSVSTDRDGFFEIWGLPAGNYSVKYQVPDGWKIRAYIVLPATERHWRRESPPQDTIRAEIVKAKHTEIRAYLEIDTQISGKVLSPAGAPMKGVCVSACWLTPTVNSFRIPDDCTDENGEFKITELPAGNYRLTINSRGNITSDNPFETFYYPGVSNKEDAQVIAVGAGTHVKDLIVKVEKTLPLITISGRLTFQDGSPFPEEEVIFYPVDESRYERMEVETDEEGNFRFLIPEGAEGKLLALANIYEMRFEKCPKVKELRKTRSGRSSDVPSNVVKIDGRRSLDQVKLTFPLPYCKPDYSWF